MIPALENHSFTIQPDQKIKCDVLYVALFGVSSLYASTLVDTQNPIAKINFQKAKQKSLASVYASEDKNSVFVIFNDHFDKMKEIHFADFITQNF